MSTKRNHEGGPERSGGPPSAAASGGVSGPESDPATPPLSGIPETHPVRPNRSARIVKAGAPSRHARRYTPAERMLILDTWHRSGLAASVFAGIVGVSQGTLVGWRSRFEADGPAGLDDRPRGAPRGSRLPEPTRRAILMLKETHPEWGLDRIHDVMLRSDGFRASPGAIKRVLMEEGYVVESVSSTRHTPPRPIRFERARPNQLWQSDLFTFTLKRENRRVYLVGFLDDHSRFVVGFALGASGTNSLVRSAVEDSIANYGAPEEVLTDQGPQYHSWRGKSAFRKLLDKRGIKHILARPRHPQTCGKIERFWRSLWEECVQSAIFRGLDDATRRIALYIQHYNFFRPHQGIGGAVPADRFFEAAPEVRAALQTNVATNALELARDGEPRKPLYLTGRVGDRTVTLHAEGDRVILQDDEGAREEVDLSADGRRRVESDDQEAQTHDSVDAGETETGVADAETDLPAPGTSALDDVLRELEDLDR